MIDWYKFIETPIKLFGRPIVKHSRKIKVKFLGLSTGKVVVVRVIK